MVRQSRAEGRQADWDHSVLATAMAPFLSTLAVRGLQGQCTRGSPAPARASSGWVASWCSPVLPALGAAVGEGLRVRGRVAPLAPPAYRRGFLVHSAWGAADLRGTLGLLQGGEPSPCMPQLQARALLCRGAPTLTCTGVGHPLLPQPSAHLTLKQAAGFSPPLARQPAHRLS